MAAVGFGGLSEILLLMTAIFQPQCVGGSRMATFFNEFFGATATALDEYGAFSISLINDLSLFVGPFLLFNSTRPEYKQIHNDILPDIIFLRTRSQPAPSTPIWSSFVHVSGGETELARVFSSRKRWERSWQGFRRRPEREPG
jgi:hypothetical protein